MRIFSIILILLYPSILISPHSSIFTLPILVRYIPRMDTEIVEQQTDDQQAQAYKKNAYMVHVKDGNISLDILDGMVPQESDANEQAQAQAKLPCQEERTLARPSLAMFGQLDEEQ